MVNALRISTVRRGYDPRSLVMVAFGGAGPLHANRLCAEMQIPLLVIPASPGTTSALGLLATDVKHGFSRTRIMRGNRLDPDEGNGIFGPMEKQAKDVLIREGIEPKDMSFVREIETRYVGQSYELSVICPNGPLKLEDLLQVCSRFHLEHERSYGRGYPEELVEFVNFRVTAVGAIPKPPLRKITRSGKEVAQARKGSRPV